MHLLFLLSALSLLYHKANSYTMITTPTYSLASTLNSDPYPDSNSNSLSSYIDPVYFAIGFPCFIGVIVLALLIFLFAEIIKKWYINRIKEKTFRGHLKNILIDITDTDEKECSICLNDTQSNNSGNTYQESTYILIDLNKQQSNNTYCKLKTCKHIFHIKCIIPWFRRQEQYTCPNCRCVY